MKIDLKPRTLIAALLVQVVLIGGFFYWKKTAPMRTYKAEIKQLKLISEHQALEIEVIKQKKELDALKKEIEKNIPRLNLTPQEQE